MKALPIVLAILAAASVAQEAPDPTRASPRMKSALMAGGSAIPEMTVKGLVLGGKREGAVVFDIGGQRILARPGVPFTVVVNDEARKLLIKQITADGIEVEAPLQKESVILPSFGPSIDAQPGLPGDVAYVEFRDIPLLDALRMLSDQTGNNYSASVDANKILVNAMLRRVSANNVVEEICKSHNLWFKRDEVSGIMRIMTVTEFEKDLVGFREEQTEVFTLRFPNVPEVANAIADLFGDRVQFYSGSEQLDEDARRDLEGRFDRFDVLSQRTQGSGGLNGNIVGGNVNGFLSNGGGTGVSGFNGGSFGNNRGDRFGGEGGASGNRRRNQGAGGLTAQAEEEVFRNLTPDQAQRVDRALSSSRREGTAAAGDIEGLRKRPASIFVSASKRNNMVVVRTADSRALADIRTLVQRMDVQTPLVLLEVKVLSIELGKGFESAFEYQITDGQIGAAFTTGVINPSVAYDPITNQPSGVVNVPGIGSTGLKDGQFVFQFLGDSVRARLQLLETKNRVKTLATPILLTANNEVSRLFLGEERPLVRGINSQTIITDNNVATTPTTTTEFRNVGNTLLITPNINSDRTVTLRLVQENSFISPNGATIPVVTNNGNRGNNNNNNNNVNNSSVQNVEIDVVGTRSVSGTFVAKDRMAIAIGGMIEDVKSDRRKQVPILGDIPGLGLLFRRQETINSRRELVVIVRPYIMTTPADSERISKDMLKRIAPESLERLTEEGLPVLPPPERSKVIIKAGASVPAVVPKIVKPAKKNPASR